MKTKRKVASTTQPTFIKVSEVDESGIIHSIEYAYEVWISEQKDGGYNYYYIPGFNIFFFAKSHEESEKKAKAAMTGFFNYWVKNQGKRAFLDELKRLGFEEKEQNKIRNYKLPKNRANIPIAFNQKVFTSAKIAA